MAYNYIPKYIRQSENKSPKGVVTASRWNELFNLLIQQGDHTAEELGKILDYLSTGLEDLTSNTADAINEKLDKTGGVISGNLGVTGKLNIGTTVSITETNNNLLQLTGDYGAPVTIRNVYTPVADNDAATKKYVDERVGGVAGSTFVVTGQYDGSRFGTFSATYAQILAAYKAGKAVELHLATDEGGTELVLALTAVSEQIGYLFFGVVNTYAYFDGKNSYMVVYTEDDVGFFSGYDIRVEDDDAVIDALFETGFISPVTNSSGAILLAADNNILTL